MPADDVTGCWGAFDPPGSKGLPASRITIEGESERAAEKLEVSTLQTRCNVGSARSKCNLQAHVSDDFEPSHFDKTRLSRVE